MIELWRQTPVEFKERFKEKQSGDPKPGASQLEPFLFPSARQAISGAVQTLGLGRKSYVGIPDFSGHCLIDFIGRHATPVPYRFLPSQDASGVLIYDQWGWEKSPKARTEIAQFYPNAKIIWDRVDTLITPFPPTCTDSIHAQIFSLSKTLGIGGGGLCWIANQGWLKPQKKTSEEFSDFLSPVFDKKISTAELLTLDRFFRNELSPLPPALKAWLTNNSVDVAMNQEHAERQKRLSLVIKHATEDCIRPWMKECIGHPKQAPGVFPLVFRSEKASSLEKISNEFGVKLDLYHFNFNDSYLKPEWKKVIALPIHSEISEDFLDRLIPKILEA